MKTPGALRLIAAVVLTACGLPALAGAQTASTALASTQPASRGNEADTLKLVVILSRHGVRSSVSAQI